MATQARPTDDRTGPSDPSVGVPHRATSGPGPRLVVACLVLLCAIWGSTYLVIRESLHDLPPFTSAGIRFAIAGSVFALLAPRLGRREGGARPTLALTACMGFLNVALAYGIVYWSETVLPSGLVSVLWSVYPMFLALSGHAFLPAERLAPLQWFGLFVGFAGVYLLFRTDVASIGPEAIPAATILLGSPLAVTIGTTILKRHAGETSSVLLNRNGMLLGAGLLLAFGRLVEPQAELTWSPRAIASVAYLVVMGTVVTFGLYYWLMRHAPATTLSLIAYVIPVVALTLGTTLAGEPLHGSTLLGSAVVLIGLAFVHRGRRRTRASDAHHGGETDMARS